MKSLTQSGFTSSKSTLKTPKQCVRSVQSYQCRHQTVVSHNFLISSLLTLNRFHTIFCFDCWLLTSIFWLVMVLLLLLTTNNLSSVKICHCFSEEVYIERNILWTFWSNSRLIWFIMFFYSEWTKIPDEENGWCSRMLCKCLNS